MSTSACSLKQAFQPSLNLRGLFVGSGSDGMNEAAVADAVLKLARTKPAKIAYVGTATYDLDGPRQRQTERFVQQGCLVESLNVATSPLTKDGEALIDKADVVLVSGGNTLYAMDRWKLLGLDTKFRQAMERGAVLTGGSAGAICWFDGGHSDSMDPDTWKNTMLAISVAGDESSNAPKCAADTKSWEYIRIQGLGFLPGLVCPHHDKIQSNGVLRATDFDDMLLRHPTETGIGIDHWAALEVQGDSFTLLSLPDREGSVLPDGQFSPDRKGKPGIWIKTVENGKISRRLCPATGKLSNLLVHAPEIHFDPREEECREQNPADFMLPREIVSGGQTGADQAGLDWAIERGIPHGGWCPADRRAEDGTVPDRFQLKEVPTANYSIRTEWNVRDSDGTVIFSVGPVLSGGSELTREIAKKHDKPCLHLSQAKTDSAMVVGVQLRDWVKLNSIHRLNVAGPRASTEPEIANFVKEVLEAAFPL